MLDERSLFSVQEFTSALALITPPHDLSAVVSRLLQPEEAGGLSPVQLSEDVLDCLSLVSESAAERVRVVLGLSAEAAARRREAFRHRLDAVRPRPSDGDLEE